MGQLIVLIRAQFEGIQTIAYNRVTGQPFKIREMREEILRNLWVQSFQKNYIT